MVGTADAGIGVIRDRLRHVNIVRGALRINLVHVPAAVPRQIKGSEWYNDAALANALQVIDQLDHARDVIDEVHRRGLEQSEVLGECKQGNLLAGQIREDGDTGLNQINNGLNGLGDFLDFRQDRPEEI